MTGAARGLGRAVSTLLAARGATVFLADVDGERVKAAAAELTATGARVVPCHTDVTDEASLRGLREVILDQAGRIDVVVNNAGGWRYAAIRDITAEDWDWTFAVNLKSVLLATRAFMDDMIAARYGRIATSRRTTRTCPSRRWPTTPRPRPAS